MAGQVYQMNVAGVPLRLSFLYPATRLMLRPHPVPVDGEHIDLAVTPDRVVLGRNFLPPDSSDSFVEYRCLIELTARTLLRYGRSIFHAAAFAWRDRAWLLTAPPGTGKTTQFLNWQRMFPGEIAMICGDMPALEARDDGSVWVHPSSWNGKEHLFGAPAARLGGIVLLQQGREDRIEPLTPRDAVVPFMNQFLVVPESEDEIRALASLLEQMLMAVPYWKMVNRGGDESTHLLRETFARSLEKEG